MHARAQETCCGSGFACQTVPKVSKIQATKAEELLHLQKMFIDVTCAGTDAKRRLRRR